MFNQSNPNTTQNARTNTWNDDFDSDQLDEDESYSWASTDNPDAVTTGNPNLPSASITNWRDWRTNNPLLNTLRSNPTQLNFFKTAKQQSKINPCKIDKLVDLCSKFVASNLPFELVETYKQPIPEDLQLKITAASFPDKIESIRLYSCLANGNADEFLKGELLYKQKSIRHIIQIGFHLSAQVLNQELNLLNVAIVCDRKRIVSCNCSCSKLATPWCSHIVAVCLMRILEPLCIEYRAPVSESLSKLKRDQLQKFAQYLISELPQQVLPTAQKLLDELLKSDATSINLVSGAPDPTAGASQNDLSIWCLDEQILQENIHKTLLKFISPAPNVVSDVECLEMNASSATSAEYTSLLRPLRGKEPEAMWNLVCIIREMFKQRDKNSLPLLRLITNECLGLEQIIQLWFLIKSSQTSLDKVLFNLVHKNNSIQTSVHQACANLMDELVCLWRIACLNPLLDLEEKQMYKEQMCQWHAVLFEKVKKFFNLTLNSSSLTNNNPEKLLRKLDSDLFSGFLPAIWSSDLNWTEFDLNSRDLFLEKCRNLLNQTEIEEISQKEVKALVEPVKSCIQTLDDLYLFDFDPSKLKASQQNEKEKDILRFKFKSSQHESIDSKLDSLFFRCEALHSHGFAEQACYLAQLLGEFILKQSNLETKKISCFQTSYLFRCYLLCTILYESSLNNKNFECILNLNLDLDLNLNDLDLNFTCKLNQFAFQIGLFALSTPRSPAVSKSLEVKLINQEQELINLLKKLQIGTVELELLRSKAQSLKLKSVSNIFLACFIFDVLFAYENALDKQLAFEASLSALSLKTNLSETQHSLLCEGIRRQKADLSLTLLLTFKDDEMALLKIMDTILDKDIHELFRPQVNLSNFNPFNPNFKKIQQKQQEVLFESSNKNLNKQEQPSEVLANSMFELARTVLSKAGGSSSSVFVNNQNQATALPHRNLHICSFLLSLYALGLNNYVQPSWLSRTYSTTVSLVNSQALEIGFAALCTLIECWQGHLTPSECACIADKAARSRDTMTVKAAAELALSTLKYANLMNLTEIHRAFVQCKEQSSDMLQRACILAENACKDSEPINLIEVLFLIAKKWYELYAEQTPPPLPTPAAPNFAFNQFRPGLNAHAFVPVPYFNNLTFPPMVNFHQIPNLVPQLAADSPGLKYLNSAFRLGMMALEAIPKKLEGPQFKFRTTPLYADDVKWLWEIAIKLDSINYANNNSCLQKFSQTASGALMNPFLIQDLIFDTANYLSRANPAQFTLAICSPILASLVQKCLELYKKCASAKMHHLNPSEHDEFINMLVTARKLYFCSGNMNAFNDLLNTVRRSQKCKKDIWNKICNALNNQ